MSQKIIIIIGWEKMGRAPDISPPLSALPLASPHRVPFPEQLQRQLWESRKAYKLQQKSCLLVRLVNFSKVRSG